MGAVVGGERDGGGPEANSSGINFLLTGIIVSLRRKSV